MKTVNFHSIANLRLVVLNTNMLTFVKAPLEAMENAEIL